MDMQDVNGLEYRAPLIDQQVGADIAPQSFRFRFHGKGGALFFVIMKNMLLTLVTLGIYMPWAKTARRKFVWSSIELHGQRLSYTGTGKELFYGYLKVAVAYFVLFGVPALAGRADKRVGVVLQVVASLAIVFLLPYAIWWSRAYVLSRTHWRGVRFHLTGSAKPYAKTWWRGIPLTLITLGLYTPYLNNRLRMQMTNATHLGTQPFRYDGQGSVLFGIWFKGLLLTIVTLGIYGFWMQANIQRYYVEHTTIDGARGRFTLTGGDFFLLILGSLVGTALTLGIAFPWILCWTLRKVCDGISFEGNVDFARIAATSELAGGAAGEGLADAFGVDLGI